MEMKKEAGYTLVEVAMQIILIGIMGMMVSTGNRMVRTARLESKTKEIVQAIEYAKHCAMTTGMQYYTLCASDTFFVRKGDGPVTLYTVPMDHGLYLTYSQTGHLMFFSGSKAVEAAGTILINDDHLGRQARITVGVASSKVRVYYEKMGE